MPIASSRDTGRVLRDVLLPVVAQGAILRRPRLGTVAERLHTDDRALRCVRRLRQTYGDDPVLLRIPGRALALVTAPEDVRRLLDETPDPFATATSEKTGALRHFQPHAVLVTDPPLRAPRRDLNEQALDSHQPVHRHGHRMLEVVREELDGLRGTLGWNEFRAVWSRVVRRIVLGDTAADDTEITRHLDELGADANWAQFHPRHGAARERFFLALSQYVGTAEPGSLVEALDSQRGELDPTGQVPHWLFAFDAAGIALWRLFAVLATRPDAVERLAAEARHPEASPLLAEAGAAVQARPSAQGGTSYSSPPAQPSATSPPTTTWMSTPPPAPNSPTPSPPPSTTPPSASVSGESPEPPSCGHYRQTASGDAVAGRAAGQR